MKLLKNYLNIKKFIRFNLKRRKFKVIKLILNYKIIKYLKI